MTSPYACVHTPQLTSSSVKKLRISKVNDYIQVLSEAKGNGNIIWKQLNSLIKPKVNVTNKLHLKSAKTSSLIIYKSLTNVMISPFNLLKILQGMLAPDEDDSFEVREVDQSLVLKAINNLKKENI